MCKCLLCQKREATIKGSHIIPSFFMKRINSIDGCNERYHELGFLIGHGIVKAYFGREVYEDTRREYTDDESRMEDRTNLDTKDNVFCPECEKMFSKYESKYSQTYNLLFEKDLVKNTKISGQEAALFWFGVIWRLSATKHHEVKLNTDFEEKLRHILLSEDTGKNNVYYALYYCKEYGKDNPTIAFFDTTGNIAFLIVDEFMLVIFNGEESTKCDEVFCGVNFKNDVPYFNNGINPEQIKLFSTEVFRQINLNIIRDFVKRINFRGKFNAIHMQLFGQEIPHFIFNEVMEEIQKAKLADMYTVHNYALAMKTVIESHPEMYTIKFLDES